MRDLVDRLKVSEHFWANVSLFFKVRASSRGDIDEGRGGNVPWPYTISPHESRGSFAPLRAGHVERLASASISRSPSAKKGSRLTIDRAAHGSVCENCQLKDVRESYSQVQARDPIAIVTANASL